MPIRCCHVATPDRQPLRLREKILTLFCPTCRLFWTASIRVQQDHPCTASGEELENLRSAITLGVREKRKKEFFTPGDHGKDEASCKKRKSMHAFHERNRQSKSHLELKLTKLEKLKVSAENKLAGFRMKLLAARDHVSKCEGELRAAKDKEAAFLEEVGALERKL